MRRIYRVEPNHGAHAVGTCETVSTFHIPFTFVSGTAREQIDPGTLQEEHANLEAVSNIFCLLTTISPDAVSLATSSVLLHIVLSRTAWGFWFAEHLFVKAGVTLLSELAMAHAEMNGWMHTDLSLDGVCCLPLFVAWQRVFLRYCQGLQFGH